MKFMSAVLYNALIASPSSRRAWIEISPPYARASARRSPSSRRAWIEIKMKTKIPYILPVALLAEGVD